MALSQQKGQGAGSGDSPTHSNKPPFREQCVWAQPLPCSNPTITSFLLDLKSGRRMPALGTITPRAWGCWKPSELQPL